MPRFVPVNIGINASSRAVDVGPGCCSPPPRFHDRVAGSTIVKRTRCPAETRWPRYRSDSGHRRPCQRSIGHARRVYRLLDRHRRSYLLQTSLLQPLALSFIYPPPLSYPPRGSSPSLRSSLSRLDNNKKVDAVAIRARNAALLSIPRSIGVRAGFLRFHWTLFRVPFLSVLY